MTQLNKYTKHIIDGNPMKFHKENNKIILDERWKNEMNVKDLAVFKKIAGKMNEKLGYY